MAMGYSDNAVMAKARALYGRRLGDGDYEQLLSKKTVGEVAAYLKRETCYAENLEEVKEDLIHREQLETFVRRRVLSTYTRFLRYSRHETLFFQIYVLENEIDQLLTAVRLLNSGSIGRFIITLPLYLAKLMSFDLFAIAKIQSFDDLLDLVKHSDYYQIIGRFRPTTADKLVDITACEAALLTYSYGKQLEYARRDYSGETLDDLEKLFRFRVCMHNASVIFRMRKYLGAGRATIAPRLVILEGDRNTKLYSQLMDAPDLRTAQQALSSHRIFRRHPLDWEGDSRQISSHILDIRRDVNRKMFRFSVQPVVTVISYMTLLEIEVDNIINIIEGIRYKLPPAEIRELLST